MLIKQASQSEILLAMLIDQVRSSAILMRIGNVLAWKLIILALHPNDVARKEDGRV